MRPAAVGWLAIGALLAAGCSRWEAPPPRAASKPRAEAAAVVQSPLPAVAATDEPADVVQLAALMREEEDPDVRREAVFDLADAGTETDTALVGQALADPDPGVRRAAVEALNDDDSDEAVSYLALSLNDADPRVRLDATEALGDIGTPEARAALQQAALDVDPQVRAAAVEMLAEPELKAR